jgi:hypothetical protein
VFWWEREKERDKWVDLDIGGRIIEMYVKIWGGIP